MNRKTNIFYRSNSNDSKFITFDNYTEALTGDILAVDYKLWPSRFLCIYMPCLDPSNYNDESAYLEVKDDFIIKLTKYYENKLAVLRDNVEDHSQILPLNYLLIFLYYYAYTRDTDPETNLDYVNIFSTEIDENNTEQIQTVGSCEKYLQNYIKEGGSLSDFTRVQLNYISDIIEQDYNGTYSDIICTINPNVWQKPIIQFKDIESVQTYLSDNLCEIENNSCLYGWQTDANDENLPIHNIISGNVIKDDSFTISDDENISTTNDVYYLHSLINGILINEVNNETDLQFNLVIPLFNVINTSNANDINDTDIENNILVLNNKVNIPLGIYFADSCIKLNINGNFSTNWSLLISTQFSPFPFSYNITQNFDNSDQAKNAYLTFAEILAKQTTYLDIINSYDKIIKSLQNRLNIIESSLNNISSTQNIDELSQNMNNYKDVQDKKFAEIDSKIEELKDLMNESRLKWKLLQNN